MLDVSDPTAVQTSIGEVVKRHGRIDVAVNCAGIAPMTGVLDITPEQWQRVIGTNLSGVFFVSQAAARNMVEHGGGVIVNISSCNSFIVESPYADYNASKAGVNLLTQSMAFELAHRGVRCVAVAPGMTMTPMMDFTNDQETYGSYMEKIPMRRPALPRDQANVVLFLASDDAAYVTGITIRVDGGIMQGFWADPEHGAADPSLRGGMTLRPALPVARPHAPSMDTQPVTDSLGCRVMQGFPPPPENRLRVDQVYSSPAATRWFMQHVREVERTANIAVRGPAAFLADDPMRLDEVSLTKAGGGTWTVAEMLAETSTDGIIVLRGGSVVYERCFGTLTVATPHLCHSITKSIASCVTANLIESGDLSPDDLVTKRVPELARSAYEGATVRHLLDMTVGIVYTEDHEDDDTEDARLDRLCGVKPSRAPDEPGSAYDFATSTTKQGSHGAVLHYVSLNTDVLGWVMERATGVAVPQLVRREVWSKLGAEDDAYIALDGAGSAQLDGGFCCSLRDLARLGQMLVMRGMVGGRPVVPSWWIDDTCRNGNVSALAAAADCAGLPRGWSYRNCFWVGSPGAQQAFMGIGMYGQMLFVSPATHVVVAKFSSQPRPADDAMVAQTYWALQQLAARLAA